MKKGLSRFISGVLAVLCVMGLCTGALAASGIISFSPVNVVLNGNQVGKAGEYYILANGASAPYSLSYTDEKGGGTTYLPIRKISELLGVNVQWNGGTNSVVIASGPADESVYTANTGAALKGSTVKITAEKAGEKLVIYTLENGNGVRARVLNLGADTYGIEVPDKNGNMTDVVLDRENPAKDGAMGAVIGRNANRIGGASFTLNGVTYKLEANNGANNLHSGTGNLAAKYYTGEIKKYSNIPVLELTYKAAEGEDLFPGDLLVKVRYALTDDNALVVEYWAVSNKDTIINMTNHAYFNLAGHASGDVLDQTLQINASHYTPFAKDSIPTGEIVKVAGTPMDFTKAKPIGQDIYSTFEQIAWFKGYDNNYVLDGAGYRKVATLSDPASGRVMDVFTDAPGMQIYTANTMNVAKEIAKDGATYSSYSSIALETQYFPDSINKPWFPSPVVKAGDVFSSTTTFKFSVAK